MNEGMHIYIYICVNALMYVRIYVRMFLSANKIYAC